MELVARKIDNNQLCCSLQSLSKSGSVDISGERGKKKSILIS